MATENTNILKGVTLQQESDKSKAIIVQPSGSSTTNTSMTITAVTTANRVITLPDATTTVLGTDVAQAITAKTLLEVDNLRLDGNTLSSLDTNGNIVISPNGTGNIDVDTSKIINLASPTATTDAANKTYVDTTISSSISASAANRTISNLTSPTAVNQDIVGDSDGARDLGTSSIYFGDILGYRFFEKQLVDSTTTGADQDVSNPSRSYLKFTNASLTSIRSIVAGGNGQIVEITNDTGSAILIRNEAGGATAADRIITGSGADLTLPSSASLRLIYDTDESRWRMIGGSGGGSTFLDTSFRIQDDGDVTKQLAFEVTGIATGTTRTITVPNNDINLSSTTSGTFATKELSNLSSTAVNANINPNIDDTRSMGTTSLRWSQIISSSFIASGGTNGIILQRSGTSPSGVTLQGYIAPVIGSSTSPIAIHTNEDGNANSTATNNLLIETGNKTAGTGNSGNINLQTGTSAGGVRGSVNHNARYHSFSGILQSVPETDAALTGADQDATVTQSYIRFTNASLTSIRTISNLALSGQLLILTNATGGILTLRNQSAGGTAANRIITGTGADAVLANDASAHLIYDGSTSRWRLVNTTAGSGYAQAIDVFSNVSVTATLAHEVVIMTTGNTTRDFDLPPAATANRKKYTIKKLDSGTGAIEIDGNLNETIDGNLTYSIINQGDSVTVVCDGTSWYIV